MAVFHDTPVFSHSKKATLVTFLVLSTALAGCEEGAGLSFLKPKDGEATAPQAGQSTKIVERDVEAPEVFSQTEAGLWDGRPSLGGVWAAHPDVTDPERVIIRNNANGKFVIGALFRREREIPGPRIQISSDAAQALGLLAGQPVELNVTALRREEVPVAPVQDEITAPEEVVEESLDPIAAAGAAIANAEETQAPAAQTVAAAPAPAPAPTPKPVSALTKPFIQIGIFSVKDNANNTANIMRDAGMIPTVKEQTSKGKTFWRVLVGPAKTKSERSDLIKKIHGTGFTDAYAVTN